MISSFAWSHAKAESTMLSAFASRHENPEIIVAKAESVVAKAESIILSAFTWRHKKAKNRVEKSASVAAKSASTMLSAFATMLLAFARSHEKDESTRPSNNSFCSMLSAFLQKLKAQNMFASSWMIYAFSFCEKAESTEQKLSFEGRMISAFAWCQKLKARCQKL